MLNKKGQITIFVILAIVIVIGGISYFVFRDTIETETTPVSVGPVKLAILDCIEDTAEVGLSIIKSNGGYLESPKFYPGSRYQPFSSELTFVGSEIPYWFYMSGSNLPKTQVPTVEFMETGLEKFLNEEIESCYLDSFRDDGYDIVLEAPRSSVIIEDDYVDFFVDMNVIVSKGEDVGILKEHSVRVETNLGYLFDEAISIYEEEQSTFFLENYTVDVLRLYAPVDGVELSCSPLTWNSKDIYEDVKEALEINTAQLRNTEARDDYFNLNLETDADVNFIYFKDWTTYFEVNPTNDNVLVAKPVGNSQGMGMLGFCYIPYHFVYNLRHPVLVQVSKDDEVFQFPMTVLIEGNLPRESVGVEISNVDAEEICSNENFNVELNIYDENVNPIPSEDAIVSFECVGVSCDVDYIDSEDSPVSVPQCANGIFRVSVPGYKDYTSNPINTVEYMSTAIILEKEYEKEILLNAAGTSFKDKAIITFVNDEISKTAIYPNDKNIELSSGDYEIQVYLYKNSELKLPATETEECFTVPRSGILGLAGMTKEECSTVEVPEQVITDALIGGGNAEYSFSVSELKNSNTLELSLDTIIVPETFEELQTNYLLFDVAQVEVELK